MNAEQEAEVTQKALRLNDVDRLVVKAVAERQIKVMLELLDEFRVLKKKLKIGLIDSSIPKINDKKAKEVMHRIVAEHLFESDKIIARLEGISGEKFNVNELDPEETEQLESDLFYSWFSGYEYVNGLYEIGTVVLGTDVPKILIKFVEEARSCFAFQKYNALCSLCRTILEVAVRDICKRKNFIKESNDNVISFDNYNKDNISQLINKISWGELRRKIKDIYYNKTSFLIHGHKTIKRKEAKELFRETMVVVQELYSKNGY